MASIEEYEGAIVDALRLGYDGEAVSGLTSLALRYPHLAERAGEGDPEQTAPGGIPAVGEVYAPPEDETVGSAPTHAIADTGEFFR